MFCVAEEKNDDFAEGPVVIIHKNWLTPRKSRSFWPSKCVSKYNKALACGEEPSDSWTIIRLQRIFYETDDLLKARNKAKEAEENSDILSTEADEGEVRKPRKKKAPLPWSSEDESDNETSSVRNKACLPKPKNVSEFTQQENENDLSNSLTLAEIEPQSQSLLECSPSLPPLLSTEIQRLLTIVAEIREQNSQILQWMRLQDKKEVLAVSKLPIELPVTFPLTSQNEVLVLEKFLEDSQNFANLCTYLSSRVGKGSTHSVNSCLRHLLTDELACSYNFKGTKNKNSFGSTSLCCVLLRAVKKANGSKDDEINLAVKIWLKHAPQRYAKLIARKH